MEFSKMFDVFYDSEQIFEKIENVSEKLKFFENFQDFYHFQKIFQFFKKIQALLKILEKILPKNAIKSDFFEKMG